MCGKGLRDKLLRRQSFQLLLNREAKYYGVLNWAKLVASCKQFKTFQQRGFNKIELQFYFTGL